MSTLAEFRLSPRLRRTLAALAPVVCSEEVDELGIAGDVVDGVELFLRSMPGPARAGIVAGLHAFEQSARLAPSSFGRGFSRLGRARARAHFERWWASHVGPLHQLARVLKLVVAFAYYEHPRVKERLGYAPERWIARVLRERRERFAAEIAAHDALVVAPDPLVSFPSGAAWASKLAGAAWAGGRDRARFTHTRAPSRS